MPGGMPGMPGMGGMPGMPGMGGMGGMPGMPGMPGMGGGGMEAMMAQMMQDPEMLAAMSNPKASPPVPATAPHRAICGCASSLRTRLAKGRSRARGAGARRSSEPGPPAIR
jgi:hypothetical protein